MINVAIILFAITCIADFISEQFLSADNEKSDNS